MALEFAPLKRREIRQAAELATRAFDDYEYFTNWFPDKEERNRVQISVIWHEYKTTFNRVHQLAAKMGSWSLKKNCKETYYFRSSGTSAEK